MQWYTGNTLYDTLLIIGFLYALLIFVSSLFGTAAYGGRFGGGSRAKGIKLHSKTGWILMELPGLIVFPVVFFMGANSGETVPLFFFGDLDDPLQQPSSYHASFDAGAAGCEFDIFIECRHSRLGDTVFAWLF